MLNPDNKMRNSFGVTERKQNNLIILEPKLKTKEENKFISKFNSNMRNNLKE